MKFTATILMAVTALLLTAAPSNAQLSTHRDSSYYSYVISFGQEALPITAVSGGVLRGKVQEQVLEPDVMPRKRLVDTVVVPLSFESSLPGTLLPWVGDSMENPGEIQRNAELSLVDSERRRRSLRVLGNVVVSKVSLPALDASSAAPARVLLELRPGTISYAQGDGSKVAFTTTGSKGSASTLKAANFRLDIAGLPTDRVTRIAPLTWTLSASQQVVTGDRFRSRSSGASNVSVGNLSVYAGQADLPQWQDWFRSFVIEGQNSEHHERSGTLTFLSADMESTLLTVELHGLGIIALEPNMEAGSQAEGLRRFMAEMYVQRIEIN